VEVLGKEKDRPLAVPWFPLHLSCYFVEGLVLPEVLQDFEIRFTDLTSKLWAEAFPAPASLAAAPVAEALLELEAELELGEPFTCTSSPTCDESLEVSPVRL
jgi:hypothetical protein